MKNKRMCTTDQKFGTGFSDHFSKLSTMIKGLHAAKNIAKDAIPKKAA